MNLNIFTMLVVISVLGLLIAGCGGSGGGGEDENGGYITGPITQLPEFGNVPTREQLVGEWRIASIVFPPNVDFNAIGVIDCPGGSGEDSCTGNELAVLADSGAFSRTDADGTETGTWTYNGTTLTLSNGVETETITVYANADASRIQIIRNNGNAGEILEKVNP